MADRNLFDERADLLTTDELLEKVGDITVDEFLKEMYSDYQYNIFYMAQEYFQTMDVRNMIHFIEINNNMDYHLTPIDSSDIIPSRSSEYTDDDGNVYKSIYVEGLGPVKTKWSDDIDFSDSTAFISRLKDEYNFVIIKSTDNDVVFDNIVRLTIENLKIKTLSKLCRLVIDAIEIYKGYLEHKYSL